MRRRGMTAEEMLPSLLVINARRCDPPLPENEVEQIARSVARYEPGAPVIPQNAGADPYNATNDLLPEVTLYSGFHAA